MPPPCWEVLVLGDLVGADESGDLLEEGFVGEAAEDDFRRRGFEDGGGRSGPHLPTSWDMDWAKIQV